MPVLHSARNRTHPWAGFPHGCVIVLAGRQTACVLCLALQNPVPSPNPTNSGFICSPPLFGIFSSTGFEIPMISGPSATSRIRIIPGGTHAKALTATGRFCFRKTAGVFAASFRLGGTDFSCSSPSALPEEQELAPAVLRLLYHGYLNPCRYSISSIVKIVHSVCLLPEGTLAGQASYADCARGMFPFGRPLLHS